MGREHRANRIRIAVGERFPRRPRPEALARRVEEALDLALVNDSSELRDVLGDQLPVRCNGLHESIVPPHPRLREVRVLALFAASDVAKTGWILLPAAATPPSPHVASPSAVRNVLHTREPRVLESDLTECTHPSLRGRSRSSARFVTRDE